MKHHLRSGRAAKLDVMGPPLAHLPNMLPPDNPPIAMDVELTRLLSRAAMAIGKLDSVSTLLPNSNLFQYMYIRLEAVLSSRIEGTQSTLNDLLAHESAHSPGVLNADEAEVFNYLNAMQQGIAELRAGQPLDVSLILRLHNRLLHGVRGDDKDPEQLRVRQNWIGGSTPDNARYVPPPADQVPALLANLFDFLQHDTQFDPLLRAGLAHAQFESIHPFLDGNGRMGRLLILLILIEQRLLQEPLLYLSLALKREQQQYYSHLQAIREEGQWEAWLKFYLHSLETAATEAYETARKIINLIRTDEEKVKAQKKNQGLRLIFDCLRDHVVAENSTVVNHTRLSLPTAIKGLEQLCQLGILRELTGQKRNRVYRYEAYYRLLAQQAGDPLD